MNRPNEDFSLVTGGPLYQLYLRSRLARYPIDFVKRRITVFILVTWLPLLALVLMAGHCFDTGLSFFHDVEMHMRFLLVLPLLIASERIVHERLSLTVSQFTIRGIVPPKDTGRFEAILQSALKWRNSIVAEVILLVLVYTVGRWLWWDRLALQRTTWYATMDSQHWQRTTAGQWYAFVSLPLFQFVLLRWYFRFFLWACFLFRVSRLDLRLVPTHPDRAGGLSFLGTGSYGFSTILLAEGTMIAGVLVNRIFFNGQNLLAFKFEILGTVFVLVSVILAPLAVFIPLLERTKRIAGASYGALANRYVQEFDDKWVQGKNPSKETLIGTADIQSLADMGNSYMFVKQMRAIPFGVDVVIGLIFITILPVLPLILTVVPVDQLFVQLIKVLL